MASLRKREKTRNKEAQRYEHEHHYGDHHAGTGPLCISLLRHRICPA
jgi:hypothetical protein